MVNKRKRKRRLRKAIAERKRDRLVRVFRNIFVKEGILKP
ncbi:DUF3983 domain-containing protein [Neobacillus sp. OS1-2]|nr:DUF3983 domain-containing protein [Neobacillus sp. OS1-2]WML38685.1 DUF3983 domain-containing protein [Neobacillus sp. OS1-2]